MAYPRIQAMFNGQIPGDATLRALAQRRFRAAGLGAEYYPESPEDLLALLRYRPSDTEGYTVHLPRDIRPLEIAHHERLLTFVAAADARAAGVVIHDQPEVTTNFSAYVAAVRRLDAQLRELGPGPLVFIEYAVGLEPATFVALHQALRDCPRISVCVDIGHVGIAQVRRAFGEQQPALDICQLKPHMPELRSHIASVEAACHTALPAVVELIGELGGVGKPLHFHLHDAHPSSTFSEYGVSDHLSFFHEIPLPFSHHGSYTLPTLFGPLGLRRIIAAARAALPDERLSFTLEIHPPQGRMPLGDDADLFAHWTDHADAERMQHWIEVLLRNHRLLKAICAPLEP